MTAPKGLKRPGVMTTVLSKKPIFLMMGLIFVIVMLLVFSIFDDGGDRNKNKNQKTLLIKPGQASTTTDEEGLNLPKPPKGKGVVQEDGSKESEDPPQKKSDREPIHVIAASKPQKKSKAAFNKLIEKQKLEAMQYRFELKRSALTSPLIKYQKDTPIFTSTDFTISNSSSRLGALKQELAQAKSSLNKLNQNGLTKKNGTATFLGSSRGKTSLTLSALQSNTESDGSNDDGGGEWDNGYMMDQETNALSIKTGSILPSVLITGINSTLAGYISCQISQNVWDTATGDNLLIPQGTKVFGQYQNQVLMGQERLFVVWKRLIFPDGRTMTLNDMPGADQLGYSGLKDQVDNHYLRIYGHALLMSIVTGTTAFAIDSLNKDTSDSTTFSESMGSAVAEQMGQTTMSLLSKHMNMSPTLNIRPGYRLNVVVVKDLNFTEPYEGKL
ncbi:type IV secretion system protein VirB10 [Desulfobacter hydrogenophilus]|uniref:Type IV secretion system protein VirB10 n=1 Tax=Desulfobacter hydrogenophilus TaxID=2291 RepID=A0A328FCA1_9BACT|nr:TrbI/VirB10 family protein [Desulfobacter hydrogenophilus]NDY73523.1 type IV secretion system protein VirB10 [Desulfobacter hydrogenophilus]QBH15702.1 type IV secretion system protein VirB10 [Desulfobacter hydrogenophilus]RAM00725.1 type IV secretion system protein VirB10 [Desulfobacter hydrogenophilus]